MELFEAIKQRSKAQHEALEHQLDLFNKIQTLADYQNLLIGFYGFYKPLEPRLAPFFEDTYLDYSKRQKIHLIEEDLRFFDHPFEIEMASEAQLPQIQTLPQALGVLYVIEGSTLGGQIISKHFKEKFNLANEQGLQFYTAYKENTGRYWQEFKTKSRELMAQLAQPDEAQEQMILASQKTFTQLSKWL